MAMFAESMTEISKALCLLSKRSMPGILVEGYYRTTSITNGISASTHAFQFRLFNLYTPQGLSGALLDTDMLICE